MQNCSNRVSTLIGVIKANTQVRELAVNPLMLSIIALVHRYRATLPDRRVDLYAECVEVLLGHWDEAKEIEVPIPPGKSLTVLQPLALWMHEQKIEVDDRTATREEVKGVISSHLKSIGLQEEAADSFLDSIRDRSGLLVERSLDVFGFQHQTFQEYLAAKALFARSDPSLLVTHFGEAYWREVTLLYAGMSNATALVQGILALPDDIVTEHWRLIRQIVDEATSVDDKIRSAVNNRPGSILEEAEDALIAARASIWIRQDAPDTDALIRSFNQAESPLGRGHFALLLAEVEEAGRAAATDVLKAHMADNDVHVRSCAALALDILGYDRHLLDDLLMVRIPDGEFTMGDAPARRFSIPAYRSAGFRW